MKHISYIQQYTIRQHIEFTLSTPKIETLWATHVHPQNQIYICPMNIKYSKNTPTKPNIYAQ